MDQPTPSTQTRLHPSLLRRRPFGQAALRKRPVRSGPTRGRRPDLSAVDSSGSFESSKPGSARGKTDRDARLRQPAGVQPGAGKAAQSRVRWRLAQLFSTRPLADDLALFAIPAAADGGTTRDRLETKPAAGGACGALSAPV